MSLLSSLSKVYKCQSYQEGCWDVLEKPPSDWACGAGFVFHSTSPSAAAAPPAFEAALDEFLSAASVPVEPTTEPDEAISDIQRISACLKALMDLALVPSVDAQQVGKEANSAACLARIMCHAPTNAS